MKKNLLKKTIPLCLVGVLSISIIGSHKSYASKITTSSISSTQLESESEEVLVAYMSDFEMLQDLERQGYDLKEIYGDTDPYLTARHGVTKIVKVRNGFYKIYISSKTATAVKNVGAGALGILVSAFGSKMAGVAVTAIVNNYYNTSRGTIYRWQKTNNGWLFQYYGRQ